MLENLRKTFLDTFLPQFCLNCDKEGEIICSNCFSLIEICDFVYCPFCKKPQRLLKKGVCANHHRHFLDGLHFATSYQDRLVKKMLANFKYEPYLKTLALPLASLIIAYFIKSKNTMVFTSGENSVFIPIPLNKTKKRKRGFNQAELLSEVLAEYFNVSLLRNVLLKIKKTPSQVGLSYEQRKENVRATFLVKNPGLIASKKIFSIDDVFTTGSTIEEAARVLKQAGAQSVWGITVAREPLTSN